MGDPYYEPTIVVYDTSRIIGYSFDQTNFSYIVRPKKIGIQKLHEYIDKKKKVAIFNH